MHDKKRVSGKNKYKKKKTKRTELMEKTRGRADWPEKSNKILKQSFLWVTDLKLSFIFSDRVQLSLTIIRTLSLEEGKVSCLGKSNYASRDWRNFRPLILNNWLEPRFGEFFDFPSWSPTIIENRFIIGMGTINAFATQPVQYLRLEPRT